MQDCYRLARVVDFVNHSVIAGAYPPAVASGEFLTAGGSGVVGEISDGFFCAVVVVSR